MNRLNALVAALCLAALAVGIPVAHAHSPEQCVKEVKTFRKICLLSPTAAFSGGCKIEETLKWCRDKKVHKEKFHKN